MRSTDGATRYGVAGGQLRPGVVDTLQSSSSRADRRTSCDRRVAMQYADARALTYPLNTSERQIIGSGDLKADVPLPPKRPQ